MTRELANVGTVSTEQLAAVLASVEAHPGGYDFVQVCVYTDGSGEIQASAGPTARIAFEYPWKPTLPDESRRI